MEPDYYVSHAISNDARSDELWGMHGSDTSPSFTFGSAAAEAWARGATGSSDVYVAVLDEGVDTGHEDLLPNLDIARSFDFLNDDGNVYDSAADWHGTHVAGTIGARGGNNTGVAGVNWNVKMISVKMLGSEANSGSTVEVIQAIDYVIGLKNNGLNVVAINASWGYEPALGDDPSVALHDAVKRAGAAGLLFIAAAGNNGKDIDNQGQGYYPAGYDCPTTFDGSPWDCIISVANIESDGDLWTSSNDGAVSVDLGAPGTGILSTTPNGYGYATGTSMAAPHVTGAAALCASLDPSASPSVIRSRILATTIPTGSLTSTVTQGRLDVEGLALACGVTVPDIVGDLQSTVGGTLTGAGLTVGTTGTAYDDSVAADRVISQDPAPGTLVAQSTAIDYVTSLGRPTVPNLANMTEAQAGDALSAVTLVPGSSSTAYDDDLAKDRIIGSSPSAGVEVNVGSSVDYTLSLGRPSVPDLTGQTTGQATTTLTPLTLTLGSESSAYHPSAGVGTIIEQGTAPGTLVVTGSSVDYALSLGPTQSPPIVGLDATTADSAITTADLSVGAVTSAYDDAVDAGLVISQDPPAGTNLGSGDAVDYVLSLGQPKVPDLVGMTQVAANAALADVTLGAGTVGSEYSLSVDAGMVISQATAQGTTVSTGTNIDYVVSLGAIDAPDVVGLTASAADTAITGLGLVVGTVDSAYDDDVTVDQVSGQDPAAGMDLLPGAAIDYTLSLGRPSVPDLTGQTTGQATTTLTPLTLTLGSESSAYHPSAGVGTIIEQGTAPGTLVVTGSSVDYALSLGPTQSPPIVGLDATTADSAITTADLSVGAVTSAYDDAVDAGLVISQDPPAGTNLGSGDAVDYVLSLGAEPVPAPDLDGLTEILADQAIADTGLTKGTVDTLSHPTAAPGTVIAQDPANGAMVPLLSAVDYTLSLGPQVAVPNVAGRHKDSIAAVLGSVGLIAGTIATAYSGTVAADLIITTSPGAGSLVDPGSSVGYTVSLGPTPPATFTPATVIVDDRSSRFVRRGTGWRSIKAGYAARSLWAPVRKSSVKRFALWRPELEAAGGYRIMAKVPPRASTKRAVYQIRTTSGWVTRVRNQLKNRGQWVNLGVHSLAARPIVRLTDKTGEAGRSGRRVGFDALKFVPVGTFLAPATAAPPTPALAPAVAPAATATPTPDPSIVAQVGAPETTEPTASEEPSPDSGTEATIATPLPESEPTAVPPATPEPTPDQTAAPEPQPSASATAMPTPEPSATPAPEPPAVSSPAPTSAPTPEPTPTQESIASTAPTTQPTPETDPTAAPTAMPQAEPIVESSATPAADPTPEPKPAAKPVATAEPERTSPPPIKPAPPPAQPTPAPPVQRVAAGPVFLVDDLDTGFKRRGDRWQRGPAGFASNHWYVPVRNNVKTHAATWRPELPVAGTYAIQAYVPGPHATSERAVYRIKTADGWVTRVRDQAKRRGTWVTLGVHRLTHGPIVQLTDQTGEDPASGRTLAFDAVRFVPTVETKTKMQVARRD